MSIKSKEKYEIITKFFGIKVNRKLYQEYNLKETLETINNLLGTDISEDEMKFFLETYPKTRKENIHTPFTPLDDRIDL